MGAPADSPAGPCECRFEDFCTCGGALAYLDCISHTCAKKECDCTSNAKTFKNSCLHIAGECADDLHFDCSGEQAACEGKFNQAENGIIGLTMDFDKIESDAFCGPTGRCTGSVKAAVKVHKPAKGVRVSCALEAREGNDLVLQQQNKTSHLRKHEEKKPKGAVTLKESREAHEAKAVKKATKKAKKDDEGGDEKKDDKKEEKADKEGEEKASEKEAKDAVEKEDQERFGITGLHAHEKGLLTCHTTVTAEEATCTMDMPPRVKPDGDVEGVCRLVEEATNEIITKDAWFVIHNAYTAPKAEPKPAPKKTEAPAKSNSITFSLSIATAIVAAAIMC